MILISCPLRSRTRQQLQSKTKDGETSLDARFVAYYAEQSLSDAAVLRFEAIKDAVLRLRVTQGQKVDSLSVADIGCNAGTQCRIWARDGHVVQGIDISNELIGLARERSQQEGLNIQFCTGSATHLPWEDAKFDVCLMPELLEHVDDWQSCLSEACRVVRPGGVLYVSTTNRLCPVQQEFNLPGYSWFPSSLKRRYEKLATTSRPELVNFATFPAVHWFTFYQLRRFAGELGLHGFDRFDMVDSENKSAHARFLIRLIRKVQFLRFLGHVATSYTVMFAFRPTTLQSLKVGSK